MPPSTRRRPFHETAILWLTITSLIVVIAILAIAGTITLLTLTLSITLVGGLGVVFHFLHRRSLESTIEQPLQRIAEYCSSFVQGATTGRIEMDAQALTTVVQTAEGINEIAQKALVDISEMKRLERIRGEFIGNVSHELRTPIFSVQGYLETLLDGAALDPEVSKQFLEKAYNNALRLNALLNDLIDISRIESGELRMSFRYLNICELARDVTHALEFAAAQKRVKFVHEMPDGDDLLAYCDKDRMVQVLTNLVENAIKYNVEDGSVYIKLERTEHGVRVTVKDTGIGISQEHHGRVFERFYRVDRDRSRLVGGTGLGLAIVKHILEAHQASISLSSEPGKGTSISFELVGGPST